MKTTSICAILCGVCALLASVQAQTELAADPNAPEALDISFLPEDPREEAYVEPVEEDGLFQLPPWLSVGADFRFRTISARNIDRLDDDDPASRWNFQRYRTRAWGNFHLDDDIDFNTRLVWEFRTWQQRGPASVDLDEVLFDHFNLTVRNLFDAPLTAVIGRQDIILGRGWLVLEGTPLDGSRTIFFDAARLTWQPSDDNTFDFIYVDTGADTDRFLPAFNDRDRHISPRDERGFISYLTNTSIEDTQLEGYFIYKKDDAVSDTRGNFPPTWNYDSEIFTLGGAIDRRHSENWVHRNELAVQTGRKDGDDLRAWGTKHQLVYHFNDQHNHQLRGTYEFLSGNDPETSTNRQFDPLWGKWPQWSELYIYTYSRETMIAETSNLSRLGFGHSWQPHPDWTLDTDYHLLWADENTLGGQSFGPDNFTFADSGKFRGQLWTFWARYRLTEQLNGHFVAEYFNPDNYYSRDNRDSAYFLRFNIEYTF